MFPFIWVIRKITIVIYHDKLAYRDICFKIADSYIS